MDKFEYLQMEKIRPIKRKWLDWLINPNVMGKKPEIIRLKKKHNGRINNNRIKKRETTKKKEHNEGSIKNGRIRIWEYF